MNRFENKTVLVTGAGSGIGAATVRQLMREGARVAAADLRQDSIDAVVAEFKGSDRIFGAAVDVAERKQVDAFVAEAVRRFGTLHGLVNSAGIRSVGTILDIETTSWQHALSVNLDGTFNVCQAFARTVVAASTRASIVNVSSTAGIRGVPNRVAYTASKHGVAGLTKAMSGDLAPRGIRVNAIAPGMIRTPMTAVMFQDPENVKRISSDHPIGRYGEPEEVAAAICFFLSDEASFISGTVLAVDGGKTAGSPSR